MPAARRNGAVSLPPFAVAYSQVPFEVCRTNCMASDGTTIIAGPVVDQAALCGLLRKVRDLGLPLIAVNLVDPNQAYGPDGNVDTYHKNKEEST